MINYLFCLHLTLKNNNNNKFIIYKQMSNKKNSQSIQYLNHSQNTSPAKTAFSFAKGSRFAKLDSESPNKFYNLPTQRSRRSTSLGFGQKLTMVNKASMDPGLYQTKGQFQLLKSKLKSTSKTTFGQSHENLFNRRLATLKTPGPGNYIYDQTNRKSKFHMGTKLKHIKNSSQIMKIGPQTYKIENCFDKSAKYNAIKSFRIKTQTMRSKLMTIEKCEILRGPGRYNPQKLLSLEQLAKNKSIRGSASFAKQRRLKTQSVSRIGPGSYELFSVFGDKSTNL